MDLKKALLPVVGLVLVAALVALAAGVAYGVVALLVGLVIVGGLVAGYGVAKTKDAPFADDGGASAAGDTTEHSDISSARPAPPR